MGTYLSQPRREKLTEVGVLDIGSQKELPFVHSAMQGWRRTMEDDHIAAPNLEKTFKCPDGTSLFAVFDGHVDAKCALFCGKYFVQALTKRNKFKNQDFSGALYETFNKMDKMLMNPKYKDVIENLRVDPFFRKNGNDSEDVSVEKREVDVEAESDSENESGVSEAKKAKLTEISTKNPLKEKQSSEKTYLTKSGATAIVVLIVNQTIIRANAGDCRAVLCRNNLPFALSQDHKPESPKERARIVAAGGYIKKVPPGHWRLNGELSLARAIGDLDFKDENCSGLHWSKMSLTAAPDIIVTEVNEGDLFLVLGCDGVFDIVSSMEVIRFVGEHLSKHSETFATEAEILKNTVEDLFEYCILQGWSEPGVHLGGDNITAQIICLKPLADIITAYPKKNFREWQKKDPIKAGEHY